MPEQVRAAVLRAADRLARTSVLAQDVSRLKYVSGAREEALRRLGIESVGDLLFHIPRRYLDFSHAYTIESAPLGQVCTIAATVDRVVEKRPRPRMSVTEVHLVDETGVLQVAFFKQPWIARDIAAGDRLAVMGKVEFAYGFKQMSSPHYEKLDAGAAGCAGQCGCRCPPAAQTMGRGENSRHHRRQPVLPPRPRGRGIYSGASGDVLIRAIPVPAGGGHFQRKTN